MRQKLENCWEKSRHVLRYQISPKSDAKVTRFYEKSRPVLGFQVKIEAKVAKF